MKSVPVGRVLQYANAGSGDGMGPNSDSLLSDLIVIQVCDAPGLNSTHW